jgi:hypothetical protein
MPLACVTMTPQIPDGRPFHISNAKLSARGERNNPPAGG